MASSVGFFSHLNIAVNRLQHCFYAVMIILRQFSYSSINIYAMTSIHRGSKHKTCHYKTLISINVIKFYFAISQPISAESIMLVGRSFGLTAL